MSQAKQRRTRADTVAGAVQSAQALSRVLQPTCDLSEAEMAHFQRVIRSREANSWAEHDLSVATQLARVMRRFDELQEQLDREGLTILNEKGNTQAHPLLNASMTMTNSIQALTRTLGLSASQRALTGGVAAKRNEADRAAQAVIERAAGDSLLA